MQYSKIVCFSLGLKSVVCTWERLVFKTMIKVDGVIIYEPMASVLQNQKFSIAEHLALAECWKFGFGGSLD